MYTLGIILTVAIIIALIPFAAYSLAKEDLFFTLLESGNIKYIYRGDTLWKIIADVAGKKIVGYKLEDLALGEVVEKTWLQKRFGMYWIGIPPFASVKRFKIKRKKELEETAGKKPTEWIRDLGELEVSSLRYAFPRPLLLEKVELKGDRQTVDLLVVCKFVTVDAYLPVVELKGDFFELAISILRGSIIDIIKDQGDIQNFLAAPKGEGGILEPLTERDSTVNKPLGKRVGLRLVGIVIPDWEPSDPKTREAMSEKFLAEKRREAVLVEADAHQQQLAIRVKADAEAAERMAVARGVRIRETVAQLAGTTASPDVVVQATARILQAEALPNLTTLVENGSAQPVVPVGRDKE